jgi:type 1 glutamine amidotransferase
MLGGEFVHHGAQQESEILAVTEDFGAIQGLKTFKKHEEWYILKNIAPDMQVLLVQNTKSMREKEYTDLAPYPETWARMHGKGRVFYSSLGHRCAPDAKKDHKEDIWASDEFKKILLGGLQWASGNVEAQVKPNAKQVCPDAKFRAADKQA